VGHGVHGSNTFVRSLAQALPTYLVISELASNRVFTFQIYYSLTVAGCNVDVAESGTRPSSEQ
jgi:hypothetical protein